MKPKTATLSLSALTPSTALANDETSHDYSGLNHAYSGSSTEQNNTHSPEPSLSSSDNWHISADTSRLLINHDPNIAHDPFPKNDFFIGLGPHTSTSKNTDFFAESGHNRSKISSPTHNQQPNNHRQLSRSQNNYFAPSGTRSATSEHSEIMTKAQYLNTETPPAAATQSHDDEAHPIGTVDFSKNDFTFSPSGLYKPNNNNSPKLGHDGTDGSAAGRRHSWQKQSKKTERKHSDTLFNTASQRRMKNGQGATASPI